MEIKRFLEKLSSDTPTPGGGSASALAGALSASLVEMVVGLSKRKGELKPHERKEIKQKASAIKRRLLRAVDEDAESYDGVIRAFRLPKDTERQRHYRSKKIQEAYKKATVIPRCVCENALNLLEYSRILSLKGNPNALSDIGVAGFLADTAFRGGLLNIEINLKSIKDRAFVQEMKFLIKRLKRERNEIRKKWKGTI
jgi:formiminotetrahydrofolate cyclodeaminase